MEKISDIYVIVMFDTKGNIKHLRLRMMSCGSIKRGISWLLIKKLENTVKVNTQTASY